MKRRYNKTTDTFELTSDEVDLVNQLVETDLIHKVLFAKLDKIITLLEEKT